MRDVVVNYVRMLATDPYPNYKSRWPNERGGFLLIVDRDGICYRLPYQIDEKEKLVTVTSISTQRHMPGC